jgi:hypothetical protein
VKLVTKLVETEDRSTVIPSIASIGTAAFAYVSVQMSLRDKVAEEAVAQANATAEANRVERMLLFNQEITKESRWNL